MTVTESYGRSAIATDHDGVDRVVDYSGRAVAALLVTGAVPRSVVLGIGAIGSEVGQVERLTCEVGEGDVDGEVVLSGVRDIGNDSVDEDDGGELALVVGAIANNAVVVGRRLTCHCE